MLQENNTSKPETIYFQKKKYHFSKRKRCAVQGLKSIRPKINEKHK